MSYITGYETDISIVLLTYNGETYLPEVLRNLFSQKTQLTYEVIAIDSGSSDRTLEILRGYRVRIIQIPNREFGHGRTRNLAVSHAAGEYVVFLTQDATPANEHWLENLVRPLRENSKVAGVYSRQIPRANCYPWESRDISIGTGPLSLLKRVDLRDRLQNEAYRAHQYRFIAFSNVSSCIRKAVLARLPFAENIVMVEDQEWCKKALEAGYWTVYEAASAVYHSHNHSIGMIFRRHFDYGVSLREFAPMPMTLVGVLFYTIVEALGDLVFILGQRRVPRIIAVKLIATSPVVRFAMRFGLYRGLRSTPEIPVRQEVGALTRSAAPDFSNDS